jgi:hypothetical protein
MELEPSQPPNDLPALLVSANVNEDSGQLEFRFRKSICRGLILLLCATGATILTPLLAISAIVTGLNYQVAVLLVLLDASLYGLGIWLITIRPPSSGGDARSLRFLLRLSSALFVPGFTLAFVGVETGVQVVALCGSLLIIGWQVSPWLLLPMLGRLARHIDQRSVARQFSIIAWMLGVAVVPVVLYSIVSHSPQINSNASLTPVQIAFGVVCVATMAGLAMWYIVVLIVLLRAYSKRETLPDPPRRFRKSVRVGLLLIFCADGGIILAAPIADVAAGRLDLDPLPGLVWIIAVSLHCMGIWRVTVRALPSAFVDAKSLRFSVRIFSAAAALGVPLLLAGSWFKLDRVLSFGTLLSAGWVPVPWLFLTWLGRLARRVGRPSLADQFLTIAWILAWVLLLYLLLWSNALVDDDTLGVFLHLSIAGLSIWYVGLLIPLSRAYKPPETILQFPSDESRRDFAI